MNYLTKKPKKIPEKSANEKLGHYKGVVSALKKRVDNLEKRMRILEDRQEKKKKNKPDVKKSAKEDFKEKYYPKKKELKDG